jgi:ABC-type antimicrobial peptide transport system permease subunit
MKSISELIISVFDLAEAEGRLLKQNILETLAIGLLMVIVALLVLFALGFLLAAFYQFLAQYWLIPAALFSTSLLCLGLAGGVVWGTLKLNQKQ